MRALYSDRNFPVLSDLTAFLFVNVNELVKIAYIAQGEWPLQEQNAFMTAISVAVSCFSKNRAFRRSVGCNHFKERSPVLKKYRQRL